jgi:hypothetical protein
MATVIKLHKIGDVVIRNEYLNRLRLVESINNPCPDLHCCAAILYYWVALSTQIDDESLWIQVTIDDIKEHILLDTWGRNKVTNCMKWLEFIGFITSRNNPDYKHDRTLQYSVNMNKIN